MSTKIYDAYAVKTFEDAFKIKDDLNKIYSGYVIAEMLEVRERSLDYVFDEQIEIEANCKKYARFYRWDLTEKFKELDVYELMMLFKRKHDIGLRGDKFNFCVSIVIFYDAVTDKKIIQFFGIDGFFKPMREHINSLIKRGVLKDIHYQNQTDVDEGIDDSDWEKRPSMWDRILGRHGIPSCSGFSYDFFNEALLWDYWEKNMELRKVENNKQGE